MNEPLRALRTIAEAAELIGVSRAHAYRLVADGELEVTDVARKGARRPKLRVPDAAIRKFQDSRALAV